MPFEALVFAVAAVLLLGVAKGGFGGIGAPVALPVMALGVPAETAIGILLPVLLTIDVFNVATYRKEADFRTILLALPGAIVGVGLGAALIYAVPGPAVAATIGAIAIVFAINMLRGAGGGLRLPRWMAVPFGAASGLTSTLAHAGGPPIHIYLLSRRYPQLQFVATANMFMAAVNVLKIWPFFAVGALDRTALGIAVWLLPVAFGAAALGHLIARVLPKVAFKYVVSALMMLAGTKLIIDAVL